MHDDSRCLTAPARRPARALRNAFQAALLGAILWATTGTGLLADEPPASSSEPAARSTLEATSTPQSELRWFDDLTEALAAAEARDARIFLDLFADWCGWCHKLEDEVFTTAAFRELVESENLVLLRVDTEDGAEGAVLYGRYSGGSLPTSVVLDRDLVRVAAVQGYAPVDAYVAQVRTSLDVWRNLLAGYESVLEGADVELQRELAGDFHSRGDARRAIALYEKILPRVQDGTEAKAWMHYFVADAYRLAGRFDDARAEARNASTLERAVRSEATAGQDPKALDQLAQRIDLLSFYVAQDDGDCPGAVASLERFVREHPTSALRPQLEQTLQTLKSDPQCT